MKASLTSILCSALVAVVLTSCHSNSYQIKGTAEGLADGDTLYVTADLESGVPTDTIYVKVGRFSFSGETDSVYLCMMYSASHNEINAPFFLEPGTISISLSGTPGNSRVGGTKCNEEWQQMNDSVMSIGKQINRIAEHIYGGNVNEEEQQKGMAQIEQLNVRFSKMVINAVKENTDNEFGYFLLTYYPDDVIDNETRSQLIEKLPASMKARPAIKELLESIKASLRYAEGQQVGDYRQQAPDGTELSLKDEIGKNRITVIDFWASWCGPCCEEMPQMAAMYNNLKDKGLCIIGVSLDEDRDAWTQAIGRLKLTWPQMSDLKGWENEMAREFSINSIPHTIVVDQQGKILRRGLRGHELEQYVTDLLQ
jgi:peroxiredoxin